MPDTVTYYNNNAADFVADTLAVDMAPLYQRFLPLLPQGAHILDAGCGSGRDTLVFRECGYEVTAFDASHKMAAIAEQYTGQPIHVRRFEELEWVGLFDGIWACASLLHVAREDLPSVFGKLAAAMKPEGVLYCSFKYGTGDRVNGGRHFTDLDEAGMEQLLSERPDLELIEHWQSGDRRTDRPKTVWLNALIRRKGE